MPVNGVAAVILAAGSSSRLGQPKQLVEYQGETLLKRTIRSAQEAGARPVLVVLGANREQIEERVDFSGAMVVGNVDWAEGIASSIRAGVRTLMHEVPGTSGVLLVLCDQPRVTAEHLSRMLDAFVASGGNVVASLYAGKRGIPAIFPRQVFDELLALRGDKGARELLADPEWKVIELEFDGGELDIDRPEDLPLSRV